MDLSNNNLQVLKRGYFPALRNMKSLFLAFNLITNINEKMGLIGSSSVLLNISYNRLTALSYQVIGSIKIVGILDI